jgi:hypothetical protein
VTDSAPLEALPDLTLAEAGDQYLLHCVVITHQISRLVSFAFFTQSKSLLYKWPNIH